MSGDVGDPPRRDLNWIFKMHRFAQCNSGNDYVNAAEISTFMRSTSPPAEWSLAGERYPSRGGRKRRRLRLPLTGTGQVAPCRNQLGQKTAAGR